MLKKKLAYQSSSHLALVDILRQKSIKRITAFQYFVSGKKPFQVHMC